MPDRSRRALRLLTPRSRQKPCSSAPAESPSSTITSPASDTEPYLLPSESVLRTHSLLHTPPHTPPAAAPLPRGCDSLPPEWRPLAEHSHLPDLGSVRRTGKRFYANLEEPPCECHKPPGSSPHVNPPVTRETPSDMDGPSGRSITPGAPNSPASGPREEDEDEEKEENPLETGIPAAVLSELVALRAAQERQHALIEASLSAAAAQSARLEATLDALRAREEHRRPGPAQIVLLAVLDAMAALLLCAVTWLIAKPCIRVWKLVKKVRGENTPVNENVRIRRSWRLSGGDLLGNDPFLASAAKRLSLTASDLQD